MGATASRGVSVASPTAKACEVDIPTTRASCVLVPPSWELHGRLSPCIAHDQSAFVETGKKESTLFNIYGSPDQFVFVATGKKDRVFFNTCGSLEFLRLTSVIGCPIAALRLISSVSPSPLVDPMHLPFFFFSFLIYKQRVPAEHILLYRRFGQPPSTPCR